MKSIGHQLREAREEKKWTPQQAAKVTKIKLDRLLDLEKDDYSQFAGPAYVRGFIRIYSEVLGLNVRRVLAQLDGKRPEEEDDAEDFVIAPPVEYFPEKTRMTLPAHASRLGLNIVLAASGVLVLVLLIALFQASRAGILSRKKNVEMAAEAVAPDGQEVRRAQPAEAAQGEAPKAMPAVPAEPVEHKLKVQATEDGWVRVQRLEGDSVKTLFEDVLKKDESREFSAVQFRLKVRNPDAVRLILDGQALALPAGQGAPAELKIPPQ